MAENFGPAVSFVNNALGYNYDTVVFQKGKPPLDSEVNLVQQLQNILNQRQLKQLASGWFNVRPYYTSPLLSNSFYTQNPTAALPEYALVNGYIIDVTNTGTQVPNANIVNLGVAPAQGNVVNGVYLEVWRALLDPNTSTNKPDPVATIDSILDLSVVDKNNGFAVGQNGLILATTNGGQTWNVQVIQVNYNLNGVSFVNPSIGWLVGDNGTIARTSSAGSSWTLLTSGTNENLNGVFARDQLTAWIVGDSGTILKTTNGVTYTPVSSGVTVNLRSIYFTTNLVGWVVGDNGVVLKTTNGGVNWISMSSGTSNSLNSVFFYDLNFGFAVGNAGTLLRSSDGGATWVSQSGTVTEDLMDVTMAPSLDEFENGEEVSGQFTGSNKNFTVLHVPITVGNGSGTTTNNPADVKVTVNGAQVLVDSVNGVTGQVILHLAPRLCDTVKIYYWHRVASGIFKGRAWVVGKAGTIMRTDNIGATWVPENPNTSYDLNAIGFSDQSTGWVAGKFQVIRNTINGGDLWSTQQSEAVARTVQRIFNEGNIETSVYLTDDSIHPDAAIETTKRVQVQYAIRVASNVDPANFPESGLGLASVVGLGPNATGSFSFQNMGPTTGDYGLWQAKCPNTVDGFCWAIPMFFVNRRNTTAYDPATNANGETKPGTTAIRPDLLTAASVVDLDILDVRRVTIVPDIESMLDSTFDTLSDNNLHTHLMRDTVGGDHYGTELLQLDLIGSGTGGKLITGSLLDAAAGNINSTTVKTWFSSTSAAVAGNPPIVIPIVPISGLVFSPYLADYSITYADGPLAGKGVPGVFSGLGTGRITFALSPNALSTPVVTNYAINIGQYTVSGAGALSHIASSPKLVKNTDNASSAFFYFGVNESSTSIVEQWDSGIPGKTNYVVAYPCADDSASQEARASTVELHLFLNLTASIIENKTRLNDTLDISKTIRPVAGDVPYIIQTVSKINNVNAGFSYKMSNVTVTDQIRVTSAPGFDFLPGTVVEVIAYVLSGKGLNAIRNGATVNFIPNQRSIRKFCASDVLTVAVDSTSHTAAYVTVNNGLIVGSSSAETVTNLTQPVCWLSNDGSNFNMYPATTSGFGTDTLHLHFIADGTNLDKLVPNATLARVQVTYQQNVLPFSDATASNGLYIGYDYVPYQGITDLPATLTVEFVTKPQTIKISDLGTGGGTPGVPYVTPLEHIPVNDPNVTDEEAFFNIDPMIFNNFSIDTGFVQMPVLVPASISGDISFSGIAKDVLGRTYYSTCSKDLMFVAEGLTQNLQRKIYVALLAKVKSASDGKLLPGEHIMVIMSRSTSDKQNFTGFSSDSNAVIAVYRLPNKPISKV